MTEETKKDTPTDENVVAAQDGESSHTVHFEQVTTTLADISSNQTPDDDLYDEWAEKGRAAREQVLEAMQNGETLYPAMGDSPHKVNGGEATSIILKGESDPQKLRYFAEGWNLHKIVTATN